jgi:hypothetical protein
MQRDPPSPETYCRRHSHEKPFAIRAAGENNERTAGPHVPNYQRSLPRVRPKAPLRKRAKCRAQVTFGFRLEFCDLGPMLPEEILGK